MIEGVPYDIPIVGCGVNTVNILRLWSSRAAEGFRLDVFNQGDYVRAVEEKNWAENVSKVLYPSENTHAGKELRLIQEYFLVACSLRDVVRRHLKKHASLDNFAEKNALQLNDTHPALAVAELMRILLDEHDLPWERAWEITVASLGYTNHTLLPEALEKWPVPLMERVLPRHLQIIYEINQRFLDTVRLRYPGDDERVRRMSLIEEGPVKQVRMANLAIVGSHAINGVARLHSDLLKVNLVPDFAQMWPERFSNKTNGITQRRWLLACNPGLAALITECIGDGWVRDLNALRGLEPFAEKAEFLQRFLAVKQANKERLAALILERHGIAVDPQSLFDVQVKRLHEYKRQLLNALHIIALYHRIKDNPAGRFRAAHVHLRRQGRARLPHGQAHHQVHQRHRRSHRAGPRRARPGARGVPAGLLRVAGRDDHPGGGPIRADFHRRQGSLRHRQHEALAQRRADDRHLGRREHRDRRGGRPRQHLHLRPSRRATRSDRTARATGRSSGWSATPSCAAS